MISHELRFIFIHIDKSAGSSITWHLKDLSSDKITVNQDKNDRLYMDVHVYNEILAKRNQCAKGYEHIPYNNAKHLTLAEYKNFYGENIINEYFKFAIVRNPYNRALSGYFFWYADINNFDGVIDKNLFKQMLITQLKPQVDYVDNTVHIVKYENLTVDLNDIQFFKKNGITFDYLPRLNTSNNKKYNYIDILDQELLDLIYNYYKNDFEIFNYKR